MKHHLATLATAAATIFLAAACTERIVDDPEEGENVLVQQSAMSECGGFAQVRGSDDAPAYCDAEMLHWSYDRATETLTLTNTRIELNCCGEHSMVVTAEGDGYVVTETDAPEMIGSGEGARCGCSCVFDFSVAAEGIAERVIQLRLDREVTDQGPLEAVMQADIDLTQGSGSIVVDDTPTFWCDMEDSAPSGDDMTS